MYAVVTPLFYLFDSRLKSGFEKISWVAIFIIPTFYIISANTSTAHLGLLAIYSLSILIFYSIYETGYLENDIITTQNEHKPTIRIAQQQFDFINNHYRQIIYSKLLIALVLLLLLCLTANYLQIKIYLFQFLFIIIFTRGLFYLHNSVRSRANIATYAGVATSKYLVPPLLFIPISEAGPVILVSFFMFPFLRILEHACKPKYKLDRLSGFVADHDLFRVKYYTLSLTSCLVISYFYISIPHHFSVNVFLYFFVFRIAAYLLTKVRPNDVGKFRSQRQIDDNN